VDAVSSTASAIAMMGGIGAAVPFLRPPLIIGHRGAASDAPENTMAAFDLALCQGADGIEIDVHLSADGVPVVIHDPRLDRTTSGSGWVSEHPVKTLKRLDAGSWFNKRFPAKARAGYSGLRIPLLSEALAWVYKRRCLAFVELKQGADAQPGVEARALEAIHHADAAPLTTVMSFNLVALRRLRELDPRISLGVSFNRPLRALRRAELLAAGSVLPHWAFASRRFIRRAHAAGLQVIVWTVNQPHAMNRKILDGVDGIITDYPARLAEIRTRMQAERIGAGLIPATAGLPRNSHGP